MSRILGIDPGTKRCGIAVTNTARTMAFPRPAMAADESFLKKLAVLVDEEMVEMVVIGRPVALSGNRTKSTEAADGLYNSIVATLTHVTVVQWDERLTTLEAQRSLSGAGIKAKDHRERIDSAAAVIMLQHYIDGLHAD
jgi:putative Holliday junction resolvase